MMASQKVAGNEVIVLSRALEILHVAYASGKARCLVYGDCRDAIRLSICESIMKKKPKKAANGAAKDLMMTGDEVQIVQMLIICGLFLHRKMNMDCRRFGLKQQQFSVLNEIIRHGPISQKVLGETLLFEKSNISKIVKILFENKWIRVIVAPHDRRLTLLSETPEGFAIWKNCMQAFHESSTEFSSFLSKNEEAGMIRLLKKLRKSFKSN